MTPVGIETATFRFVAQHLNHCATAVPNIAMDLQEVGFWGIDWIELAQDNDGWRALLNSVMNLRFA